MNFNRIFVILLIVMQCGVALADEPLTGKAYQLADQAYKSIDAGDLDEADTAVREALTLKPNHPQLLGILDQVRLLRESRAYELADEAYKASDAGNLEKADKAVKEALRLKPDHPNLLKLHAHVQKLFEQRALRIADKAYKAAAEGDLEKADSLTKEALRLQPDHPRILALLASLQIMRNEDDAAMKTLNRALEIKPDFARVLGMRGFVLLSQGNEEGARADFLKAMQTGGLSFDEGGNVAMALADLYSKEGKYEEAVAVLEPFSSDGNDKIVAKWQANLILTGKIPDLDSLVKSHEVQFALSTKAYEELAVNNDTRAIELFLAAESMGGLTAVQYGDTGYAARRAILNDEAVRLFTAAIDVANDELPEKKSLKPAEVYGLRRAVDDLYRDWGVLFTTSFLDGGGTVASGGGQSGVISGAGAPTVSGPATYVQTSAEIYYQPPIIGYRDGRQFQIFAYSYETIHDGNGGPVGGKTNQGSIGVRWKPLRDHNLVLTAERLIGIGRWAIDDWLLRVGYSYDHGVDIKQYEKNWTYRTLFVETAYLTEQDRSINNLEARWGHVFRFSNPKNLTFIPHLLFSADVDSASLQRFNAGVGAGASLRWWFRETKHRAPASYLDFTVQYKEGLVKDATRQDGILARLLFWY